MKKNEKLIKKLGNNSNADASFSEKRSGLKDRRELHTFLMNDRRSGIADRRRKIRVQA